MYRQWGGMAQLDEHEEDDVWLNLPSFRTISLMRAFRNYLKLRKTQLILRINI